MAIKNYTNNSGGLLGAVKRLYRTGNQIGFYKTYGLISDYVKRTGPLPVLPGQKVIQSAVESFSIKEYDVLIPVYEDAEATSRCISSVLSSIEKNTSLNRIIVVDDCGTSNEIRALMKLVANDKRITYRKNPRNLGFIRSVNLFLNKPDRDLIILNSDTEVSGDWADRLARHANSEDKIATVTPFSNNATIFSFPKDGKFQEIQELYNLEEIDAAFQFANPGIALEIPTGHGFCMFLKAEYVRKTGPFDTAFGLGYGEENDLCMRLTNNGLLHVLALDCFVFHQGEASFQDRAEVEQEDGMRLLTSRYPYYLPMIAEWCSNDPIAVYRIKAMLALLKNMPKKPLLMALHSLGGGTEKHVYDLVKKFLKNRVGIIVKIQSYQASHLLLDFEVFGERFHFNDRVILTIEKAAELLSNSGANFFHIHHTLGWHYDAAELIRLVGLPYGITMHDYFFVCPRVNLYRVGLGYCHEPNSAECNTCIALGGTHSVDIVRWRRYHEEIVEKAEWVVCPSVDTQKRIQNYFPKSKIFAVPNEDDLYQPQFGPRSKSNTAKRRTIGVLGALNEFKGLNLLERVAQMSKNEFDWILIGTPSNSQVLELAGVKIHGEYSSSDIGKLIDHYHIDALFYPNSWPETYSYTLSEGMNSNRLIIAPNIGAFPERLKKYSMATLYDLDLKPEDILYLIKILFNKQPIKNVLPEKIEKKHISFEDFYGKKYG